jgi:hypothetical protein
LYDFVFDKISRLEWVCPEIALVYHVLVIHLNYQILGEIGVCGNIFLPGYLLAEV